jgi:hypothetical protein
MRRKQLLLAFRDPVPAIEREKEMLEHPKTLALLQYVEKVQIGVS